MTSVVALQARDLPQPQFVEPVSTPPPDHSQWIMLVMLFTMVREETRRMTVADRILTATCDEFDLTMPLLRSSIRSHRVSRPRQLAMYLMWRYSGLSSTQIGVKLNKDHTSVVHARRAVENRVENDENQRILLERIKARALL